MVFGLVGLGTLVHSAVDFVITLVVWKALSQNASIAKLQTLKKFILLKMLNQDD